MGQRLTGPVFAVLVGFHAALIFVFVPWLVVLRVATALLLPGPDWVGIVAALLATGVVCGFFVRMLLRTPLRRWARLTLRFGLAPVTGAGLIIVGLHIWLRTDEMTGPASPSGLTAVAVVRDGGLHIGADYYCDVRIVDAAGKVVAEWKDHSGQQSRDGTHRLRDSMRWRSADTLEFTTLTGAETLTVR